MAEKIETKQQASKTDAQFIADGLYEAIKKLFDEKEAEKKRDDSDEIGYAQGSVPVAVAAKVYGKDACWVRAGIISGWLPIGNATRNGKPITSLEQMNSKFGRIRYYISPKLLWEQTGYVWKGEKR